VLPVGGAPAESLIDGLAGADDRLWPLLFEPLHDALIEDSLDRAVAAVCEAPYEPARWPRRARVLRWLLKGLL
jgi:hypothetical protein